MSKWVVCDVDASTGKPYLWKCDECGEEVTTRWNYCPECGDPKTSKGKSINKLVEALEAEHKRLKELQNLATDKNVVSKDTIYRQAAIDAVERAKTVRSEDGEIYCAKVNAQMNIHLLPSAQAQLGTNLAEEYARAVRNWLVNYQVKCADLAGRYTPYEVLGWIVSDWRKENGIW